MAKKTEFGVKIPRPGEIAKIDGDQVVDQEGDSFEAGLVKANQVLGGGFELVDGDLFGAPKKREKPKKS